MKDNKRPSHSLGAARTAEAKLPVGLIGFGSIGQQVAQGIASGAAGDATLIGILVREPRPREAAAPIFTDFTAFLATTPRVVLEAAGGGWT